MAGDIIRQLDVALDQAGPLLGPGLRARLTLMRLGAKFLGTFRFPLSLLLGAAAVAGAVGLGWLSASTLIIAPAALGLGLVFFLGLESARLRLIRSAVRAIAHALEKDANLGAVGGHTSAAMPSGFAGNKAGKVGKPDPSQPQGGPLKPERPHRTGDPDAPDFDDA